MDPDMTLYKMLDLAHFILQSPDTESADALELAELIQELDRWLTRGGFTPDRWGGDHPCAPMTY